jgi:acetyl-CoA carboxylase biotin carboxyl carrier protein
MAKKSKAEAGAVSDSFGVNLSEIERLLAFMQSHGLEELEYQRGGLHVRLKKASTFAGAAPARAIAEQVAMPAAVAPVAQPAHAPASASPKQEPAADVHTIKSPIVGTYYAAPSPEADPFVTVGAKVDAGQVLCIIEAMKLMNEIESDVAGEVVRIHVENGKPVEYGAPLFDIRTRSK